MGRHLSVRVGEDLLAQLDTQSRRSGQSRSAVAKRLLQEGLRMEEHPRIVFRSGPAGRRAGLIGGPDVWEVVRALPEAGSGDGDGAAGVAERMGLAPDQVSDALRYYADHRDEIDEWIRRVQAEADRAEARWRREQELLAR